MEAGEAANSRETECEDRLEEFAQKITKDTKTEFGLAKAGDFFKGLQRGSIVL
jgi:hypothetical protein